LQCALTVARRDRNETQTRQPESLQAIGTREQTEMKAEDWIRHHAEHPYRAVTVEDIQAIINDAHAQGLRDAAEIARQQDQIIDPRPTAKKIVGLIEAAADKLQPGKAQ